MVGLLLVTHRQTVKLKRFVGLAADVALEAVELVLGTAEAGL